MATTAQETEVGKALRLVRASLGWSQAKFAKEATVSISALAQVEQGNVDHLGPRIEGKIFRFLMAQSVDARLIDDLRNAQYKATGVLTEGDRGNGDATGDATGAGDSSGERTTTPAPISTPTAPTAPTASAGDATLTPPPFAPANMALLVPSAGGWWLRIPSQVPIEVATRWAQEAQQYADRSSTSTD